MCVESRNYNYFYIPNVFLNKQDLKNAKIANINNTSYLSKFGFDKSSLLLIEYSHYLQVFLPLNLLSQNLFSQEPCKNNDFTFK